jgi:hypothetical protein
MRALQQKTRERIEDRDGLQERAGASLEGCPVHGRLGGSSSRGRSPPLEKPRAASQAHASRHSEWM